MAFLPEYFHAWADDFALCKVRRGANAGARKPTPRATAKTPAQAPAKSASAKAAAAKPAPLEVPQLKFEKYKLENGLDVILSEDHRLPLVAVNLWYHVGPANELPGRTGFAHLFEHMMLKVRNTWRAARTIAIWKRPAHPTSMERRILIARTISKRSLRIQLNWRYGWSPTAWAIFRSAQPGESFEQQDVVRNERRQSLENAPYGVVEEGLFHQLFPKEHPYYAEIIGSHAASRRPSSRTFEIFFKLYYAPKQREPRDCGRL